jgi:hypothetical protein
MSYSIAWEKRGTCITYTGTVSFKEFMAAVLTIHQHPDYPIFKYAIHDMGRVSDFDFSDLNMTQLLAQELGARYTNPNIRASVVTNSAAMCELVREFSSRTKLNVGLLQSIDQARDWSEPRLLGV